MNQHSHLVPEDVIDMCVGNVLDNLRRYAFTSAGTAHSAERRLVSIELEESRSDTNDPMIELRIKNNGNPIKADAEVGHGGHHANAELNMFGGRYERPLNISDEPWRVLQRILFLVW